MRPFFLAALLVPLTACTGNQEPASAPSSIIGQNQLRAVDGTGSNVDAKYRPLLDAFGNFDLGCTATHIGQGIAISAGHCFEADNSPRKFDVSCNQRIVFGDRPGASPVVTHCTKILILENDVHGADFAIFKVSGVPDARVEVDLQAASVGDAITIFGHPQGRQLEWSDRCKIMEPESGLPESRFGHQCDTEPGSSGSTILDDQTLKVIGIHNSGSGSSAGRNHGTLIAGLGIDEFLPVASSEPPTSSPFATLTNLGTINATPFMMVAGLDLFVREGTEISRHYVTWDVVGSMDVNPAKFAMVAGDPDVYVREDAILYRRTSSGAWAKVHEALAEPFAMAHANGTAYIRQGQKLLRYSGAGQAWTEVGTVGAEPFQMTSSKSRVYTREGSKIRSYDGGAWTVLQTGVGDEAFGMVAGADYLWTRRGSTLYRQNAATAGAPVEVGSVGAEPFTMTTKHDWLITREGSGLHKFVSGTWTKMVDLGSDAFDMAATPTALYIRRGNALYLVGP